VPQSLPTGVQRAAVALVAIVFAIRVGVAAQAVTQPALRAAFLFNFAKFTEWPGEVTPSSPLTLCVLDDSAVEGALSELVGTGPINGRAVTISRGPSARLRACHLLYVGDTNTARTAAILDELRGAPVLTVSDGAEFIRSGGIIGLIVEEGRMRFAINPDAAQRAGLRLSSRLLQLAKISRDDRHDRP
jgi:YfiR/HmsC-like